MNIQELRFDSGGIRPDMDGLLVADLFPRVCPIHRWTVATRYGDVVIPYGFLSDGASRVSDLDDESYMVHDLITLRGRVGDRTITNAQAAVVYADILWRKGLYRASIRRLIGLLLFGGRPWRRYRRIEAEHPDYWTNHVLPKALGWELTSFQTRRAVWVG